MSEKNVCIFLTDTPAAAPRHTQMSVWSNT